MKLAGYALGLLVFMLKRLRILMEFNYFGSVDKHSQNFGMARFSQTTGKKFAGGGPRHSSFHVNEAQKFDEI